MKYFQYGSKRLTILGQKNTYVPKSAYEVELLEEDKNAIAVGIQKNYPILLIGEAGTGKTSIARYIAHKREQGYVRISMTGYATPDELIGSKSVKNGATYHEDGILTRAMKEGHLVVLDEINATPPDCLFILHGLLDDDKRIALPNGELVIPHPDFRFIATMNPDYEGTKSLNRALLDRFSVIIPIQSLNGQEESKLLQKRTGITKEDADGMVATASYGRKSFKDQKTMTWISTRTLLQWAELLVNGVERGKAYQISVANKAPSHEVSAFLDFYKLVFKKSTGDKEVDRLHLPYITTVGDWEILKKQVAEAEHKVVLKEKEMVSLTIENGHLKKFAGKSEELALKLAELKEALTKGKDVLKVKVTK